MTATEELRLMLNESGVDWDYGITGATTTRFNANGVDLTFTPMRDGLVCSTILTPEQAIDAALGSNNCTDSGRTNETCHADETGRFSFHVWNGELVTVHVMECSECGGTYEHVNGGYEFCPRCGRKVVDQ